jgi:hypothetical protein
MKYATRMVTIANITSKKVGLHFLPTTMMSSINPSDDKSFSGICCIRAMAKIGETATINGRCMAPNKTTFRVVREYTAAQVPVCVMMLSSLADRYRN